MSKFYVIEGLISLSNYSKKYKVSLRKIYRYIADKIIEHYMIDDVPYLIDEKISLLKDNHTRDELKNNVKTLTESVIYVKNLTQSSYINDNQEVNSVKVLTEKQMNILNTSDINLNSKELDIKYKLLELINKINELK